MASYERRTIAGFQVLVNPRVSTHREESSRGLALLSAKLAEIQRLFGSAKTATLVGRVKIWVEWDRRNDIAAEFHRSATWLQNNGYLPEKENGIEISNLVNFTRWTEGDQPMTLVHVMAIAYLALAVGNDNPDLRAAYDEAVQSKRYESVERAGGTKERAYAIANSEAYFAELSEAYFGRNDFYPFTKSDLRKFDARGFALMERTWGSR
jgi:hypothetical protein